MNCVRNTFAAVVSVMAFEVICPRFAMAGDILLYTSIYTTHFNGNEGLNNRQHLLGVEYQTDQSWVFGVNEFKNSFNQQTEYLYLGKKWRPFEGVPGVYAKLTAGALHGYVGDKKNKIPFNGSGTAPAVIPSIGFDYSYFNIEATTFYAGAMLLAGVRY